MKAEDKQKWLDALRSGEYKQCRYRLGIKGVGYCCLGIYAEAIGLLKAEEEDHVRCQDGNSEGDYEMQTIFRYKGCSAGRLPYTILDDRFQSELIHLNDVERLPFDKIADWIEAKVPVDE